MQFSIRKIEAEAFKLPVHERIILAQELLSESLSNESPTEKAWYDEAERRLAAFKSGRIKAISGKEIHRKLRSKLSRS